jgi:hypothetical protein
VTGNPPQLDKLEGLALEYARIPHWQARMLGRFHPSKRKRIAVWARHGISFHGRMVYTEGPQRGELFHRLAGQFAGAHADCSQYGASCAHWSGVKRVDAADWTGTLWDKGKVLLHPVVGCGVIFGPYPGVHFGIITGRANGQWLVCGFGTQTGPDANTLAELTQYFLRNNHPGTRYIDLTR